MPTDRSQQHEDFVRAVAPLERDDQEPLGPHPTYDAVLDVAVEYTFPASDPVAVDSCCKDVTRREQPPSDDGPGQP